jgi:hypothetical protein
VPWKYLIRKPHPPFWVTGYCTGAHQIQSQGAELRIPPLKEQDEEHLNLYYSEHSTDYFTYNQLLLVFSVLKKN